MKMTTGHVASHSGGMKAELPRYMSQRKQEDFSILSCYRSRSKCVQIPVTSEILRLMADQKDNNYLEYNFSWEKRTQLLKVRKQMASWRQEKQMKNIVISSTVASFVVISHSQRFCLFFENKFIFYLVIMYICYE